MAEIRTSVRDGSETAYASRAVLDEATLACIVEANEAFLRLIAAGPPEPDGGATLGLPARITDQLRELGETELSAIAACPYTLFNLRFEDPGFWRSLLARQAPARAEPPARLAFARTAVFLAWHLARSDALAAALVLGMSPEVQRAWCAIPLPVLESATPVVLPHLSARFASHPSFWPRLLAAARPGGRTGAESVRLLGLQLLAADGAWPAAGPTAA